MSQDTKEEAGETKHTYLAECVDKDGVTHWLELPKGGRFGRFDFEWLRKFMAREAEEKKEKEKEKEKKKEKKEKKKKVSFSSRLVESETRAEKKEKKEESKEEEKPFDLNDLD